MSKRKFIIEDWTGKIIKFKDRPYLFDSFDDAEEVLSEELGTAYETDREEYYIQAVDENGFKKGVCG